MMTPKITFRFFGYLFKFLLLKPNGPILSSSIRKYPLGSTIYGKNLNWLHIITGFLYTPGQLGVEVLIMGRYRSVPVAGHWVSK